MGCTFHEYLTWRYSADSVKLDPSPAPIELRSNIQVMAAALSSNALYYANRIAVRQQYSAGNAPGLLLCEASLSAADRWLATESGRKVGRKREVSIPGLEDNTISATQIRDIVKMK